MKKKLLTLGLGIVILATSVAAVSANEDVKVLEGQSEFTAQNNAQLRDFGGAYKGMSLEEILAQMAEERGISVAELQEEILQYGNGFLGGMMRGFSGGSGYNEELLQERAAEAGLTVEEYIEKQLVEREVYREVRHQEMAERMGIPADEFGPAYGNGGRCGGRGLGMSYRN